MMQLILMAGLWGGIIVAILLMLRGLFKKRMNPKWQYMVWSIALCRLLMPFQLPVQITLPFSSSAVDTPAIQAIQTPATIDGYSSFTNESLMNSDKNIPTESDSFHPGLSLSNVLLLIWSIGACLVLLRIVYINISFRRKIVHHAIQADEDAKARISEIYQQFGVENHPEVMLSHNVASPCLAGIIHPKIFLPPSILADETTLRHVLVHEYCHFKQRDNIIFAISSLALMIHWYNPLVWIGLLLSRRDCELSSDARVLHYIHDSEEYGMTLVNLTNSKREAVLQPSLSMSAGKRLLSRRINFILQRPQGRIPVFITFIVIVGLFLLTACGMQAQAENPISPVVSEQLENDTSNNSAMLPSTMDAQPSSPSAIFVEKRNMTLDDVYKINSGEISCDNIINYFFGETTLDETDSQLSYWKSIITVADSQTTYFFDLMIRTESGKTSFQPVGLTTSVNDEAYSYLSLPCRQDVLNFFVSETQNGKAAGIMSFMSPDKEKTAEIMRDQNENLLFVQDGVETALSVQHIMKSAWSPDSRFAVVPVYLSSAGSNEGRVVIYDAVTREAQYHLPEEIILSFVEKKTTLTDNKSVHLLPIVTFLNNTEIVLEGEVWDGEKCVATIRFIYSLSESVIIDSSVSMQ